MLTSSPKWKVEVMLASCDAVWAGIAHMSAHQLADDCSISRECNLGYSHGACMSQDGKFMHRGQQNSGAVQDGGDQVKDTPESASTSTAFPPDPESRGPDAVREATYIAGQPSAYPGLVLQHGKASGRGKLR